MSKFDPTDLDEAMNAIKEEILQDLSDSISNENFNHDPYVDNSDLKLV